MDSFSCSPLNTSYYILETEREKDFQNIMNTLKCGMVTSFKHYNDETEGRVASVHLSLGLVRVCEINRIHHWRPVGSIISTRGPSVPVGNEACLASFPTERWTRGLDFSGTTEHR